MSTSVIVPPDRPECSSLLSPTINQTENAAKKNRRTEHERARRDPHRTQFTHLATNVGQGCGCRNPRSITRLGIIPEAGRCWCDLSGDGAHAREPTEA